MPYETMMYIAIGISIVMFVISIILFFQLNIPHVLGGLTGYTARKEIEQIKGQNAQGGKKGYQTSPANRARGKVTSPLGQYANSGNLLQMTDHLGRVINKTELLTQEKVVDVASETTVLSNINETTVLSGTIANETTVLSPEILENSMDQQAFSFAMEVDETVVHTEETIV